MFWPFQEYQDPHHVLSTQHTDGKTEPCHICKTYFLASIEKKNDAYFWQVQGQHGPLRQDAVDGLKVRPFDRKDGLT